MFQLFFILWIVKYGYKYRFSFWNVLKEDILFRLGSTPEPGEQYLEPLTAFLSHWLDMHDVYETFLVLSA